MEYDILGFIDDEPAKQHMRIHDIEVIGTVDQLDTLTRSLRVQADSSFFHFCPGVSVAGSNARVKRWLSTPKALPLVVGSSDQKRGS